MFSEVYIFFFLFAIVIFTKLFFQVEVNSMLITCIVLYLFVKNK